MYKLLLLIKFIYLNNYKYSYIIKYKYIYLGIDFSINSFIGIEIVPQGSYIFNWNVKKTNYIYIKFKNYFNKHSIGVEMF